MSVPSFHSAVPLLPINSYSYHDCFHFLPSFAAVYSLIFSCYPYSLSLSLTCCPSVYPQFVYLGSFSPVLSLHSLTIPHSPSITTLFPFFLPYFSVHLLMFSSKTTHEMFLIMIWDELLVYCLLPNVFITRRSDLHFLLVLRSCRLESTPYI